MIRKADPARAIVIGPGRWNSISELPALRLPDDDNIIATVHSYDPFFFSHQGAPWTNRGDDGKQKGIQFPGPPSSSLVPDSSLRLTPGFQSWIHQYNTTPAGSNPSGPEVREKAVAAILEWSDYYGRPVYLGEFGAIKSADSKSRANYYREFRGRLEKAGVGWALWDWHAGFNYWDVEHDCPEPGMREALFGRPRLSRRLDPSHSFPIDVHACMGALVSRNLWDLTWTPGLRDDVEMFLHRPVPRFEERGELREAASDDVAVGLRVHLDRRWRKLGCLS